MARSRRGKGECDRCGFIYKLRQLRTEWTGFKVCPTCWDPLPKQDFPDQLEAERTALIDPRPEHDIIPAIGRIKDPFDIIGRSFYGAGGNAGVGTPEIRG